MKGAKYPRIHLFLATSDIHMEYKLKMTREQVVSAISEMVAYAKAFCDDIEFSAEDASRSEPSFLARCYSAAVAAGATTINVPDTVGYSTPQEMSELIAFLREHVAGIDEVDLSVHCHDDLGMAVANSLACVRAGATQVECTVNGIGERAGNASLEEVVMDGWPFTIVTGQRTGQSRGLSSARGAAKDFRTESYFPQVSFPSGQRPSRKQLGPILP